MPLRPTTTRTLCTLAAVVILMVPACSSSQKRDMHYGTDAGVGYVPADAAPRADIAPDTRETSSDLAVALDGASPMDGASNDEGD